jgi:hypothetical protein
MMPRHLAPGPSSRVLYRARLLDACHCLRRRDACHCLRCSLAWLLVMAPRFRCETSDLRLTARVLLSQSFAFVIITGRVQSIHVTSEINMIPSSPWECEISLRANRVIIPVIRFLDLQWGCDCILESLQSFAKSSTNLANCLYQCFYWGR